MKTNTEKPAPIIELMLIIAAFIAIYVGVCYLIYLPYAYISEYFGYAATPFWVAMLLFLAITFVLLEFISEWYKHEKKNSNQ